MQTIHRVRKVDVDAACLALGKLISGRMPPNIAADQSNAPPIQDYLERACISQVLFATSSPGVARQFAIDQLHQTFNAIVQRSNSLFSPQATHAAQTLIWKAAAASDPDTAERWFVLLRHPLFDGAGQVNKARIGR